MAEVFRARDAQGRFVAIKRILPSVAEDEEFIQMFRDEAAIASQLDHPNIAQIYDVGKVDLSYYLALEFVGGKDLRIIFDRAARAKEPLPLDFIVFIISEVCKGLEYAHLRADARGKPLGLVHRDVSPQNVLISFDADVKIIDFGIAKAAGKLTRTQVGTIKGKFGYMSPEQVRGLPIDRRSDVFSLGICLWELIALERLFFGDNEIAIMEKIRACDVPPLASKRQDLPAEMERIVGKALAKDVDERYATAAELDADLTAFARTEGLQLGRERAAEYMRRVFAGDPALNAAPEEKSFMAERKNGSDLDVFEGLSKKNAPSPDEAPTPFAPHVNAGAAQPLARHKTLLGMPAANLPPPGFPVTPGKTLPPPPRTSAPPPMPRPVSTFPGAPAPRPLGATGRPSGPPPLPPQPAAGPPARAGSAVDVEMDWDEDDEKTTVFEKEHPAGAGGAPAAAAPSPGATQKIPVGAAAMPMPPNPVRTLTGTGASVRPPAGAALPNPFVPRSTGSFAPPPRGSVPPGGPAPPMGRTAVARPPMHLPPSRPSVPAPPPMPRDLARSPTMSTRAMAPRSRGGSKVLVWGTVLAAIAGFVFFVIPKTGRVKVFVAGTGMKPLDRFAVFVDGSQRCAAAPCTLELEKGVHAIKATADGYNPQEQGATVAAGEESAINFRLDKAVSGTGFRIGGRQDGVELFVDGKEIGPLPQEIKDLSAGSHRVLVKGSDRYAQEERTITLAPNEISDLGTVVLKVLRGLATFDVRTPGTKVTLVSGKERRQLTDFSQPVEIETSKNWTIEATKTGYDDYKQPIGFEDRAERTFVIELAEHAKPAPIAQAAPPPAAPERPAPAPVEKPRRPAPEPEPEAAAAEPKAAAAAGGNCTLNFNSIPVSNVILDGRPIGGTPKLGVTAAAGPHNVVFINAEEGRKSKAFTCKSGETQTVAVRLTQ
jgi:serine/threonine protein kinase